MGNSNRKKIVPLPIPTVLTRLKGSAFPEDRETILDFIEMIDINITDEKRAALSLQQLIDYDGMALLVKIAKKMYEDALFIQLVLTVLEILKSNTPVVMDFIQYGGLDILDKAIRHHVNDQLIAHKGPSLLKYIIIVGAKVTVEEIQRENVNLQLCQHCADLIERSKKPQYSVLTAKVVTTSGRMNRVLKFMENYIKRVDVMVAGMDAVITFTTNPDGPSSLRDTNVLSMLGKIFTEHSKQPAVVWRVCFASAAIAMFSPDCGAEIARINFHEPLVSSFQMFSSQPMVQQQILNLFAAFLTSGQKSAKALQRSKVVMDFLKQLIDSKDETIDAEKMDKRNEDDDLHHFELVVPLPLRTFMRESSGDPLMENERQSKKAPQEFKQRRNFGERPVFGTVTDLYSGGEKGLIAGGPEEEAVAEQQQERDWEKALTYGKVKKR